MADRGDTRFRTALADLLDCLGHMDVELEDDAEQKAREKLIGICADIADQYGSDLVVYAAN